MHSSQRWHNVGFTVSRHFLCSYPPHLPYIYIGPGYHTYMHFGRFVMGRGTGQPIMEKSKQKDGLQECTTWNCCSCWGQFCIFCGDIQQREYKRLLVMPSKSSLLLIYDIVAHTKTLSCFLFLTTVLPSNLNCRSDSLFCKLVTLCSASHSCASWTRRFHSQQP